MNTGINTPTDASDSTPDDLFDNFESQVARRGKGKIGDKATNTKKTDKGKRSDEKPTKTEDKIWSNDDVEMLLGLWENNECLYKKDHLDHLDANKRSNVIRGLAEKNGTTISAVNAKMKSMHSYFCQVRTRSREPVPSGSSSSA